MTLTNIRARLEEAEVVLPIAEPSEDAIALAFTRTYRGQWYFDHDAGKWYGWDGTRFKLDARQQAFHFAREFGRKLSDDKRSLTRAAIAGGAERFARADPAHAVDSSVWDKEPMMLGTPNGTIDLESGVLSPPNPADMITRQTSIAPEHGEPTLWLRFLNEALGGDVDLIRFVRQWCGYCLTGDTREHALTFIFGPGKNGKSVFLNTIAQILGDYAATATMETFTASKYDRHSTELAMLKGARLVSASETEAGRAWAEARIKSITGGDPITARFMRQDNFTFQPQFKLMIAGNHAPQLKNVDEAMRRRFNILPFVKTPEKPDRLLETKLRAEHGRILAWSIAGCRDWLANGLLRSAAVKEATASYFADQDIFSQWVDEQCDVAPDKWDTPTDLFNAWKKYALAASEDPGTTKTFKADLIRRGFRDGAISGMRVYRGIKVRQNWASSDG